MNHISFIWSFTLKKLLSIEIIVCVSVATSLSFMAQAQYADLTKPKPKTVFHGNKNTPYNSVGNFTSGSDGSLTTTIGNQTFTTYRNGTSSTQTKIGNHTFQNNSDGKSTSSTQIGNSLYNSNGTTINKIGNSTFDNNGTVCTTIGEQTFC